MTKRRYFFLANAMVIANGVANMCAVVAINNLMRATMIKASPETLTFTSNFSPFYSLSAGVFSVAVMLLYEQPIRQCLKMIHQQETPSPDQLKKARRKLLNEPYFAISLTFFTWIVPSIILAAVYMNSNELSQVTILVVLRTLLTGLAAVAAAFFLLEYALQMFLAPVFFPEGRLWATPGTLRLWIGARLAALALAISIVPFCIVFLGTWEFKHSNVLTPQQKIDDFAGLLLTIFLIFIPFIVGLTCLVTANLTRPLKEMTGVLRDVRNGLFHRKVKVVSNDELGYTGDVINEMTEGLQEREIIKDAFGKYVAEEVRDEVLSGRIPLDGEKKEVTVLFSDLRNFTPMTEENDPKLVVKIMNSYFKEMAEAIQDEGGLVLQFIGDEIYAVFGAPVFRPDHPARAFRAGLEMRRRLVELNKHFEEKGWPKLSHGIGVHTGEALAANIGSPDRLSYLLVGDTVNLASRLQSLTKEKNTDMIISSVTHSFLNEIDFNKSKFNQLPPTQVKGKNQWVEVFALA
ncbi:MAG: adenylate/guanylate cyclase domain-containing protein [Deltaproteobacteria bacterium]|jgi:adenylate cyclase|nr:adenylate/guanylate cyclase domain-containing protein [Deltaproteobacteria bacterium]